MVRKYPIHTYCNGDIVAVIKHKAEAQGVSVAHIVRQLVIKGLGDDA